MFCTIGLLSHRRRISALLGGAEPLLDLEFAVDPEPDHIRGPLDASVTVVEYGDFECPYCGRAEPAVRELLRGLPPRVAAPAARMACILTPSSRRWPRRLPPITARSGRARQVLEHRGPEPRVRHTPFFINGPRHHGAYDIDALSRAVRAAGGRAKLAAA